MIKGLMVVLVSLFLSLSSVFALEVSEREKEIYFEYEESVFHFGQGATDEEYNEEKLKVRNKYGITIEEFDVIYSKMFSREPSERDLEIYNDWSDKLDTFPDGATSEELKKMFIDVGEKYGIPPFMVREIYMRVFLYKYMHMD